MGLKTKRARNREGGKKETRKVFYFTKTFKQLNSNMGLNSNTPKTMHRHVCYSKLLYFII
jgi:hypothetical protein